MDIFHLKRLQCCNDAVFAIVATILVLPVRKLEERDKSSSLEDQLNDKWPQLLIYLVGFLVICAVWESRSSFSNPVSCERYTGLVIRCLCCSRLSFHSHVP